MRRMVRRWAAYIKRHTDILWVIGSLLIIAGSAALVAGRSTDWLRMIGGIALGAGLTVLVATISSKRAVHEQYAKDANLRRKHEIYGPLHAELKKLREALESAREEKGPYPQRINITGDAATTDGVPVGYDVPTLLCWLEFKTDFRADDFTQPTQKLLDEIDHLAKAYNEAITATREPTAQMLGEHVQAAITSTKSSPEYQVWDKTRAAQSNVSLPVGQGPVSEYDWFQRFDMPPSPGTTQGDQWAHLWLERWPQYGQPVTLGWLLGGQWAKAAHLIHEGYQPRYQPGGFPAPPLSWTRDIFEAAWPELNEHPTYKAARAALEKLYRSVHKAEKKLEDGLRWIQDRYEGGPPPV